MNQNSDNLNVSIRRRPFYLQLLWIIWVLWLLIWAEFSVGSWQEIEYRAFGISITVFLVSLLIGSLVWFRGHLKSKK